MTTHEHDHANARGGFWILPDGSSLAVAHPGGHSNTLYNYSKRTPGAVDGRMGAYRAGWVRLSSCNETSDAECCLTFTRQATVAALREAARIVRHRGTTRPHTSYRVEDWDTDENSRH